MQKNIFDPEHQQQDLSGKIVIGLERISEVFKLLLWDKSKVTGLSPIQIQLLLFLSNHKETLCNISHLAKEFNVTKPTISDAVRVLEKKGHIEKCYTQTDHRSYTIILSASGNQIVKDTYNFIEPIQNQINKLDQVQLEDLFKTLSELIYKLNRAGILQVQRTCFSCKFYRKQAKGHYCMLLEKELLNNEIRLDCPEFEQ